MLFNEHLCYIESHFCDSLFFDRLILDKPHTLPTRNEQIHGIDNQDNSQSISKGLKI